MGFLSSIFGGNKDAESKKKKDFDILKYDGIRAQRIGKLTYAIKCFKEAIEIQEDLETMNHLSSAYIQVNQMEEALAVMTRMTEIAPTEPVHFLSLASLCYMMEDYQGMDNACKKALAINEQIPVAYLLSAKAAIGMKNGIQSIAMLTKAIMLKDDYAEAYQMRAEILWSMRQAKDAMEDVEKLLSINPEDETALLLKAEIIAANGNAEESMELINQVIAMNPFNENAYLLKGNLLLALKELDKAIEVYDEAIELKPDFAQAYHERGRAKLEKGDKEGSMEDMKKSIELAPQSGSAISGQYNNYDHLTRNVPF
jgi:tetratricopeptide (TPR) repeat protein